MKIPEKEYKSILDREKNIKDFNDNFSDAQKLLIDIVNYGTNLIPRCFVSSSRKQADAILLGVLLKQIVTMLDSAEVLISNGCIYPSKLQTRALFEASIYIDFILKSETEKKALYYYVSNLRIDRLWALRTMGESPDQEIFDSILLNMGKDMLEKSRAKYDLGKLEYDSINDLLSKDIFKEIDEEFDKYKKDNKLKFEPNWYNLFKYKSIRAIAQDLGRIHEYEFFYSMASDVTHTSRYKDHIRTENGKIIFKRIRSLEGIKGELNILIATTLKTYGLILEKYRPGEIQNFKRKYINEWREIFFKTPSVKYNIEEFEVI